jgi:hypothetical protein
MAIPDHFVVLVNTKYSRNSRNGEFLSGSPIAKKCVIRLSCNRHADASEKTGLPKDLHGFVYVEYDQAGRRRYDAAREINAAGYDVDVNKI